MFSDPTLYACRVCGLLQVEPPWGEDRKTPNFEICDCCGVEFGYEDCSVETARLARERWKAQGFRWHEPTITPQDWSLEKQLQQIPIHFQ